MREYFYSIVEGIIISCILIGISTLIGCQTIVPSPTPQRVQTVRIVVDFALPDTVPRMFVYRGNDLILSSYVTHGIGSGAGDYATSFSNAFDSHASSLGVYRIVSIYSGVHGRSYKLQGLDATNSNAYQRLIEVHQADYIGEGIEEGHSWGCFAVPEDTMKLLLKLVPIGTLLEARD